MRVFVVQMEGSPECIWKRLDDALTEIRELLSDPDQVGYVEKITIEERQMSEEDVDGLPEFQGY